MDKQMLELYTDYLLSSFGATTATGLSSIVEGAVSHDQVTRFLSREDYDSKTLWQHVKPMVRAIERTDGALIFDDTIEEKPYTDENELISWHFDHSQNRSVKGINILNCVYHAGGRRSSRGLRTHPKTAGVPRCEDRPAQAQERGHQERTHAPDAERLPAQSVAIPLRAGGQLVFRQGEPGFHPLGTGPAFRCCTQVEPDGCIELRRETSGRLLPHRLAGVAGTPSGAVLAEGVGFSGPARSPGLYKQGWQRRDIVSGFQRSGLRWPNRLRDLPETVESGDLA